VKRATKRQNTIFNILKNLNKIVRETESDNFTEKIREIEKKIRVMLLKGLKLKSVKLAIKHPPTQFNTSSDNLLLS
jgi:hypothetical protein